jgi:hypothetical protein
VRFPARGGDLAVRPDQPPLRQPRPGSFPLLVGPAADGLEVFAPHVQGAAQDQNLTPVGAGRRQGREVPVAPMLTQDGGRLPQPGDRPIFLGQRAARLRQRGVGRRQHPPRAVQAGCDLAQPLRGQHGLLFQPGQQPAQRRDRAVLAGLQRRGRRGKLPDRGDRALDHGRSEVVERRGHDLRAGGPQWRGPPREVPPPESAQAGRLEG